MSFPPDGPFPESKELGLKRAPFHEGEVEIRQVFESADFEPVIKTEAGREVLAAEDAFRSEHGQH